MKKIVVLIFVVMAALSAKAQFYVDRKSTRLNSSHWNKSRMPSSA